MQKRKQKQTYQWRYPPRNPIQSAILFSLMFVAILLAFHPNLTQSIALLLSGLFVVSAVRPIKRVAVEADEVEPSLEDEAERFDPWQSPYRDPSVENPDFAWASDQGAEE
jgi:hypothetical protein